MKKLPLLMSLAASSLLLVACGGGGGSDDTPGPLEAIPDSASASSAGMVEYLEVLSNNASDTAEPLDVTNFDPPAPDDTEPESVS